MAQTMIMAGGTWIALRKLRSIQAMPATPANPAYDAILEIADDGGWTWKTIDAGKIIEE